MKIEKHSDTWRSVEVWATDRRERYRRLLEVNGKTELEYAQLRAKIEQMSALLDLPTKEQA